jgi:hypothetical protein
MVVSGGGDANSVAQRKNRYFLVEVIILVKFYLFPTFMKIIEVMECNPVQEKKPIFYNLLNHFVCLKLTFFKNNDIDKILIKY